MGNGGSCGLGVRSSQGGYLLESQLSTRTEAARITKFLPWASTTRTEEGGRVRARLAGGGWRWWLQARLWRCFLATALFHAGVQGSLGILSVSGGHLLAQLQAATIAGSIFLTFL